MPSGVTVTSMRQQTSVGYQTVWLDIRRIRCMAVRMSSSSKCMAQQDLDCTVKLARDAVRTPSHDFSNWWIVANQTKMFRDSDYPNFVRIIKAIFGEEFTETCALKFNFQWMSSLEIRMSDSIFSEVIYWKIWTVGAFSVNDSCSGSMSLCRQKLLLLCFARHFNFSDCLRACMQPNTVLIHCRSEIHNSAND